MRYDVFPLAHMPVYPDFVDRGQKTGQKCTQVVRTGTLAGHRIIEPDMNVERRRVQVLYSCGLTFSG